MPLTRTTDRYEATGFNDGRRDYGAVCCSNESCEPEPCLTDLLRSGIILCLPLLHDRAGASLRPPLDARGDPLQQDRDAEGHLLRSESHRKARSSLDGLPHRRTIELSAPPASWRLTSTKKERTSRAADRGCRVWPLPRCWSPRTRRWKRHRQDSRSLFS